MAVQIKFLKSIPYFSKLSPAELDSIKKHIFEKTSSRGEMILLEGEPAKVLYFVVSGVVKVFKTSADGKEQILYLARPGESFNDVPILDGGPNHASVRSMGSVVLYGIMKNDLQFMLQDIPQLALNANKVLAARVRHLESLVEDLSFRHVIGRVARILLEHAGDGTGSRPRLTQQDMAAMAGTAREMIGRSIKALEDEGIIRMDRHRIIITNEKALSVMSGVTD
ncbi:Crp/Fnr family transcriptional regulator [Chloroflexota bacterium]